MMDDFYPKTWEIISENLRRLKVPGGWIVHNSVHVVLYNKEVAVSESMIFIPDEHHTWGFKQK